MTASEAPRLSRSLPGMPPAAGVRIVHIGLGNFHRAHQCWYTAHAPDAAEWGIASFTGNSARQSDALAPQDGLYTLIVRGGEGDSFEPIGAICAAHPASDHRAWLDYLAAPQTALVTVTVTEQGYLVRAGHLDKDAVAADAQTLRTDARSRVTTMPARILAGLIARRAAGSGAITVLPCDNLPDNGHVIRTAITELAEAVDASMLAWIQEFVDFASCMVDRITPATTDDDREAVTRACGWQDLSPVPTEPFSEWVISGTFPAGRPRWEEAGAHLVADVEPFERRKLWLLNGSHSLMAYAGSVRGQATIAEAIGDSWLRDRVNRLWDEACAHLSLPADELSTYREALIRRFENPRIRHNLAQIAHDGSTKLGVRVIPVARVERDAGRMPLGCATALAGWVLHLRGAGVPVHDALAERAQRAAAAPDSVEAAAAVLETLDAELASDPDFVAAVAGVIGELAVENS